ncbi:MAG: 4-(cytidine 5'-diphospho)-2-C-methyl-D-erythritol kinase [Chthoniobacterales bacterium]
MPALIRLSAPAKINLSLRLLGKRVDGYHELETLMAPIVLADEIEITHAHTSIPGSITLTCNDPAIPTNSENLCVKAAEEFQKATGLNESVTITLLKRIPHGAGLGGGSSDAAATLRGLNELFNEPLVFEELHQIATGLGSDVPFFLAPQPTWCRGRGEVLEQSTPLPDWRLLLIKPPFPIPTAWAYQQFSKKSKESSFCQEANTLDNITIQNDLEEPVFKKYLVLPVLKRWLQERSEVRAAWMTGSGSTMVAVLDRERREDQVALLKKNIATDFGETFWMMETRFVPVQGLLNSIDYLFNF